MKLDGYATAPAPLPEWPILAAVRRNLLLIVLFTLLGLALGFYRVQTEVPVHPVQAELLIRIGYEYTPVSSGQGSDDQQVTYRLDEVIGTEIQLLTSLGVVESALEAVPYPEPPAGADPAVEAPDVWAIAEKFAVKRIEGSTVVLATVTDENEEWARAFLEKVLEEYLVLRDRLFAADGYSAFLQGKKESYEAALAALSAERIELSQRLGRDATDFADGAFAPGNRAPAKDQGQRDADLLSLRLFLAELDGPDVLADILRDGVDVGETPSASPVGGADPSPPPAALPDAGGTGAEVTQIMRDAARLDQIDDEREAIAGELATITSALLRQQLRGEANRNVTVMTAPHVLGDATGLTNTMKVVMSALVAMAVAILLTVAVAGLRGSGPDRGRGVRSGRA